MLHRQLKTLNRENDNCSLLPFSLSLCPLILEGDLKNLFNTATALIGLEFSGPEVINEVPLYITQKETVLIIGPHYPPDKPCLATQLY